MIAQITIRLHFLSSRTKPALGILYGSRLAISICHNGDKSGVQTLDFTPGLYKHPAVAVCFLCDWDLGTSHPGNRFPEASAQV